MATERIPAELRHAFLIFAHDKFDLLERLLHLLDDERNDIFVHLDKKSGEVDTSHLVRRLSNSRVVFVPRIDVYWAHYSQVEAVLRTLAVAASGDYAYFHVLSGADLPLQSNDHFHAFFRDNAGKEFVAFNDFPPYTHEWLAYYYPLNQYLRSSSKAVRRLYSRFRKLSIQLQKRVGIDRTRGFDVEIRYGSDWFSVTHDLARYLLDRRPEIERIFRASFNPVEYYVQTMVWNSPFRDSVFDLDDPYRSNMRLIDFKRGTGSSPHTWTMEDAAELLASDRLFARKFDPAVDREIIDVLSKHVGQSR